MQKIFTLLFALLFVLNTGMANDPDHRMDLNPLLAPFYHGVASGDPLKDAVIIWTRVTTTDASVDVSWEMSTDTSFASTNIIATGSSTTDAGKDYTVKVDVPGLTSNTYYYYRFMALGETSMIGRTKTAPSADDVDQVRFATVSCSSWQHGYFNAYQEIADRNDVDAVLHLGDYIYEYGPGEYGDTRDHEPPMEIIDLVDYRTRYAQYRLDPMVRNIHQQYPFITVWDDHESADNSWRNGAENHTEGAEGSWEERLSKAAQVYHEWLPIRSPDPGNDIKIYRKFSYGDLADIFVLDTRIIGRDEQLGFIEQLDPDEINNPERQLLGEEQLNWLKDGLSNSTAKWKILAQQVMVGPFRIFDVVLNSDQWDGYAAERDRLFSFVEDNNIDNIVVLTGDIHTSWAMDLPLGSETYVPSTGENSVGVEFVTTSVTSPGFPIGFVAELIKDYNKHMKYVELTSHGYTLLNLTDGLAGNEYHFVREIEQPSDDAFYRITYYTEDGDNHLQWTFEQSESIYPLPIQAPDPTDTSNNIITPVILSANIEVTGVYPNPVIGDYLQIQFFLQEADEITIELHDMAGSMILSEPLGARDRGIYIHGLDLPKMASGSYAVVFRSGNNITSQSIIKID